MKNHVKKFVLFFTVSLVSILFMMNCSGKNELNDAGRNNTSYTYATTSSVGDYSEWTFDGTTNVSTWARIDQNGIVDYTLNVNATCGTYNSTYNHYTCTINTASCTEGPGTDNCPAPPSGTYKLFEQPGASLIAITGTAASAQLHVGFVRDTTACLWSATGDYVFIRTGLGNIDMFGMYRLDSNFVNITDASFTLKAVSSTSTPSVQYLTEDAIGAGTQSFTDNGCNRGLRLRTRGVLATNYRVTTHQSGYIMVDRPSGQGGLVGFKINQAAALGDLANKTFTGIYFKADGSSEDLTLNTGSAGLGIVTITSADLAGTPLSSLDIRPLSNANNASVLPAYPNFTAGVSNTPTSNYPYTNNSLATTYNNASDFPGMFRIDGFSTTQDRIVMAAAKFADKILVYGFVYNYKRTTDTPPTGTTFPSNDLYNMGNFIFFER